MDNLFPLMTISNLKKPSLVVLPLFLDSNKLRVRIPREDKRDKFLRQIPFVHCYKDGKIPSSHYFHSALSTRGDMRNVRCVKNNNLKNVISKIRTRIFPTSCVIKFDAGTRVYHLFLPTCKTAPLHLFVRR